MSKKHDIKIEDGAKIEKTQPSIKIPNKGKQDNYRFLSVGVYKAGVAVLSQVFASTTSLKTPEREFFYRTILDRFSSSINYICAAFEKNSEIENKISRKKMYEIALERSTTFSHSLRVLYDANFLSDSQYCAIRAKLLNYMDQLNAILKSLK